MGNTNALDAVAEHAGCFTSFTSVFVDLDEGFLKFFFPLLSAISVDCVRSHKESFSCTGKRPRTEYAHVKDDLSEAVIYRGSPNVDLMRG